MEMFSFHMHKQQTDQFIYVRTEQLIRQQHLSLGLVTFMFYKET